MHRPRPTSIRHTRGNAYGPVSAFCTKRAHHASPDCESMQRAKYRPAPRWLERRTCTTDRLSSSQPPKARDFKPNLARHGEALDTSATSTAASQREPKDPARGLEAAKRAVQTGKLDDRYKSAARKYTALMCATPIAIYLSYELYRRLVLGIEQKELPTVNTNETDKAT